MRLLIAGILTLVIFIMTCAFGNEEKKALKVEKKEITIPLYPLKPSYYFYPKEIFPSFISLEDWSFAPIQTF